MLTALQGSVKGVRPMDVRNTYLKKVFAWLTANNEMCYNFSLVIKYCSAFFTSEIKQAGKKGASSCNLENAEMSLKVLPTSAIYRFGIYMA
jgi:hypothetical protein